MRAEEGSSARMGQKNSTLGSENNVGAPTLLHRRWELRMPHPFDVVCRKDGSALTVLVLRFSFF